MPPITQSIITANGEGRSATSKPRLVKTPVPIMLATTMLVAVTSEMAGTRPFAVFCVGETDGAGAGMKLLEAILAKGEYKKTPVIPSEVQSRNSVEQPAL